MGPPSFWRSIPRAMDSTASAASLVPEPEPPTADGDDPGEARLLEAIRAARFGRERRCPHCDSARTIGWGRSSGGRRRYRCRGCGRTFSDLTGTPLAYTKRLDRWLAFGDCMRTCISVRAAAARLGIDKDTAFRWRHRLASAFPDPSSPLPGPVALAGVLLPYSEKGRRDLQRSPRTHRGPIAAFRDRVHVVFACPEGSLAWEGVPLPTPFFAATVENLTAGLAPRLARGTELVMGPLGTGGRPSSVGQFAVRHGYRPLDRRGRPWQSFPAWAELERPSEPPRVDAERAEALARRAGRVRRRWQRWMVRFCGVASRYLWNYLRWFRQCELLQGLIRPLDRIAEPELSGDDPAPAAPPGSDSGWRVLRAAIA